MQWNLYIVDTGIYYVYSTIEVFANCIGFRYFGKKWWEVIGIENQYRGGEYAVNS